MKTLNIVFLGEKWDRNHPYVGYLTKFAHPPYNQIMSKKTDKIFMGIALVITATAIFMFVWVDTAGRLSNDDIRDYLIEFHARCSGDVTEGGKKEINRQVSEFALQILKHEKCKGEIKSLLKCLAGLKDCDEKRCEEKNKDMRACVFGDELRK